MNFISIVSPVYNSEGSIVTLIERIKNVLLTITDKYEIILVEDGGNDNSWDVIERQALLDSRIKGIKLSRNFGQHYAITAGLDYSQGEWIVVMDNKYRNWSRIDDLFGRLLKKHLLIGAINGSMRLWVSK